ncbi:MAG: 16S rRNA (guanine(966)-N(2))-methyltransferase RsmD [Candidatus Omnitrophica bacterium]|nr:16S rRNA (guanine(966)-N(2))-methyltransferase RsmD [Candidatus Omnitrophota bacterium]
MKVISGLFKGRNLICPKKTRPVTLMVKKACFDILKGEIVNKNILDLFGGSGSLGIEAISLGAKNVVFVDINKRCIEAIKKNLLLLKITNKAILYQKEATKAIKDFSKKGILFDVVFLDPPYYKGILRKVLQTLEVCDIVTPFGYLVCFCYIKDDIKREIVNFSLILEKNYGQTLLLIYKHK